MAHLAALYQYPVKSLAGLSLSEIELDDFGPSGDRRWMIVDREGRFVTQRRLSSMALVRAALEPQGLMLTAPDRPLLEVPWPDADAAVVEVQVWSDTVRAQDAGEAAALWLAATLGEPLRLVYLPDAVFRRIDPDYVPDPRRVSFADGFPILLLSRSAVEALNERLDVPVDERHFRPNLVIEGVEPHAEDHWHRIRIGEVELHCVKPCSRCVMTTVWPDRGERRADGEPLRTLQRYRRTPAGVMFGQNVVHVGSGRLRVGDTLEVLERRP